MEAPLKELTKLEKFTAGTLKGKTTPIETSLDSLLQSLREAKARYDAGELSVDTLEALAKTVEILKKEVEEREKEIYSSVSRIGKTLDKKFTNVLPSYPDLFTSEAARSAMERTIALHFLRTGQFETAQTFLEESKVDIPPELRAKFIRLHGILKALRAGDITPALSWATRNRDFLQSRDSPLEFYLHRSQYMRLLLSSHPSNIQTALAYANSEMRQFFMPHEAEFKRLTACILYLPRIATSVYADLCDPALHADLEPLFAKEYCANLGMSKQVPLRVVGDIGGGGALAKLEKGRRVMREKKSEWSQADELPIELPVPPENRYHSVFTCPVSKEQSTEKNPPMMMACGHVISKDSLQKLSKSSGRVKCPYCPAESQSSMAIQVHF